MGDVDPVAGQIERPQEAPIRTRGIAWSTDRFAEYLEPMFPEGNVNYDDLAFAGDLLWDSWRTDPYD
ncbi:hypothetical protein ACLMAL_04720 [Nocardia sp. CWNU-33]|uniref:hypothetical protein n=1 Tax=Nocardia sp. CWNU-33 TaxID=3392117 RepID=UPI00398EC7C9